MSLESLIEAARAVRKLAYAPYSNFPVGAALLAEDGRMFVGCNVENISFGLTQCAERNAVFTAVSAGARRFSKIVVVAESKQPVSPCGACRQVLSEFSENMEIVSANLAGDVFHAMLSDLLPRAKTGILD